MRRNQRDAMKRPVGFASNRNVGETTMSKDKREMHPENSEDVNRRAFIQAAAGAVTGVALGGVNPEIAAAQHSPAQQRGGGHLYMQTNETRNVIVHYRRSATGMLAEVERVPTGG